MDSSVAQLALMFSVSTAFESGQYVLFCLPYFDFLFLNKNFSHTTKTVDTWMNWYVFTLKIERNSINLCVQMTDDTNLTCKMDIFWLVHTQTMGKKLNYRKIYTAADA